MATPANTVDELETWRNISRSRHVLKKFGAKGDLIDEMIAGKKQFHVSTRERHINTEMAAEDKLDPFTNGMFVPVTLLDSTEDAEQIASNPNVLSESEMVDLVKGAAPKLKARLEEIINPIVVERLREVAADADVQASKMTAIEARLEALQPKLAVEVDQPRG